MEPLSRNDTLGFAAGDDLIRSVGRALQHTASDSIRVGHIGGDDFLVLTEPEGLEPLAASVLDVPGPIDMATVYVQPDVGRRLLRFHREGADQRIRQLMDDDLSTPSTVASPATTT